MKTYKYIVFTIAITILRDYGIGWYFQYFHIFQVDALKKRLTLECAQLNDTIMGLEQALKKAEHEKSKLSSEVSVLIKDVEHSQVVIKVSSMIQPL